MKIALWTGSAYKIRLLQHVLTRLDTDPEVVWYDVASGVSDQPQWVGETKQWALNRAKAALQSSADAEIGCGIEFGYEPFDGGFHCLAYACILDRAWNMWLEHSSSFKLPKVFSDALAHWVDLKWIAYEFDTKKPNNNVFRAASDYLRKDELLIQAYRSVFVSYLSDGFSMSD